MTGFQGPLRKTMTHRHGHPDDAGVRHFYFSKWEAPNRYGTFYVIESSDGELRAGFEPTKTEDKKPAVETGGDPSHA